ncbi:MAG: hypothetical protein U0794_09125 [Isosphaeraceae bacterium]
MNRVMVDGSRVVLAAALAIAGAASASTPLVRAASLDEPGVQAPVPAPPQPHPPGAAGQPADTAPLASDSVTPDANAPAAGDGDRAAAPVRALTEGPLHEAFLSPAKDRDPDRVAKAPPPPIVERPGVEAPDPRAQWIEGYWDWDDSRKDYLWVTGTWRVPPPGRFWVNGYWKRDENGWYRVAGFWSDRKTDRIDFRKNGPPAQHPPDEPGDSPGDEFFFVPGQYYPDGDGVVWKPGFWAKAQPGWAWVPSQWVRQPEGWTFQEGFWDRTLEDRGTLFAPAEVAQTARDGNTVYQPYTQVSPETYGQLYGAFGRPNSYYDGYPGCYYDPNGRYYGYANYGSLGAYYGYLDYPYLGTLSYPYITSGVVYSGLGYGGLGYGGWGGGWGCGLLGGMFPSMFGFGMSGFGYPWYGMGYGGWGWGGGWGGGWGWGTSIGMGWGWGGGLGLGLGFGWPIGWELGWWWLGLGWRWLGLGRWRLGLGRRWLGWRRMGWRASLLSVLPGRRSQSVHRQRQQQHDHQCSRRSIHQHQRQRGERGTRGHGCDPEPRSHAAAVVTALCQPVPAMARVWRGRWGDGPPRRRRCGRAVLVPADSLAARVDRAGARQVEPPLVEPHWSGREARDIRAGQPRTTAFVSGPVQHTAARPTFANTTTNMNRELGRAGNLNGLSGRGGWGTRCDPRWPPQWKSSERQSQPRPCTRSGWGGWTGSRACPGIASRQHDQSGRHGGSWWRCRRPGRTSGGGST